jgi:hypothetical protein
MKIEIEIKENKKDIPNYMLEELEESIGYACSCVELEMISYKILH